MRYDLIIPFSSFVRTRFPLTGIAKAGGLQGLLVGLDPNAKTQI